MLNCASQFHNVWYILLASYCELKRQTFKERANIFAFPQQFSFRMDFWTKGMTVYAHNIALVPNKKGYKHNFLSHEQINAAFSIQSWFWNMLVEQKPTSRTGELARVKRHEKHRRTESKPSQFLSKHIHESHKSLQINNDDKSQLGCVSMYRQNKR